MFAKNVTKLLISASILSAALPVVAQETTQGEFQIVEPVALDQLPITDPAIDPASDPASDPAIVAYPDGQAEPETNDDEIADDLNSRQQIEQTFTLKRSINGEVVETAKRTVTFDRNDPYRASEAGLTALEKVKQAFDGEVLTRPEAFEEAKLDFTIADTNADFQLTFEEFSALVDSWQENAAKQTKAPSKEVARQRQYDAFIAELNPEAVEANNQSHVWQKFSFMAGAQATLSREDYIREYLLDFDSMDANNDTLLQGNELMRFRAINRGESIDM